MSPDAPSANRLELAGRVVERQALRFTPAGVAVIDLIIEHGSVQSEAGAQREVALQLAARAIGDAASRLDPLAVGTAISATGFLARRSHRSKSVLFHIQQFEVRAQ